MEDDFNFYQSSARITVECVFGEIYLHWDIFWKHLSCSLHNDSIIIEGAMYLHIFLVDYRKDSTNDINKDSDFNTFQDELKDTGISPIVAGNDIRTSRGRLSLNDKYNRLRGLQLKDTLKLSLANYDMHCPSTKEWTQD